MQKLFDELSGPNWALAAQEIYDELKPVIQGNRGVLKKVRSFDEEVRRARIATEKQKFLGPADIVGLDERINDFLKGLFVANFECQQSIYYNLVPHIIALGHQVSVGEKMQGVIDYLNNPANSGSLQSYRLNMIVGRIVNESAGQSNKSNAGSAGEDMVTAILNAIGLVQDVHFRRQYKSSKGSDTDFVLPYVKDFEDHNVEVFIAVQLSTNDRARLASSELKKGGQQFLVTGNGMEVSKKGLFSIGTQILESYKQDNIRLVCYAPEIEKEKARLSQIISQKSGNEDCSRRLDYFSTHALGFEEFARRIQTRFGPHSAITAAND